AQLYGDPQTDTMSGGRQMNCHFSNATIDREGRCLDLKNRYNVSADISPTAGQMARGLGLAFASKKFRENPALSGDLSENGQEVVFCTIGDASTSEGVFWETLNAAGVLQVPLAVSVWDDGFGISVPRKYQTAKDSISAALRGLDGEDGVDIVTAKAWDYPALCQVYEEVIGNMRRTHRPALLHIQEVTQQLGHSTSGDHRRYKSPERLAWEEEYDCNRRMESWMLETGIASEAEISQIKTAARKEVQDAAQRIFQAYHGAVAERRRALEAIIEALRAVHTGSPQFAEIAGEFAAKRDLLRHELLKYARRMHFALPGIQGPAIGALLDFIGEETRLGSRWYSDYLY
ncbi:MAG: thiamine pyrophosphate-dependent dehydrogenase E1 component subunit alpha, partial [Saprospiraceae bacterium]